MSPVEKQLHDLQQRLKALTQEAQAAGIQVKPKRKSKVEPYYSESYHALVIPFAWSGQRLANWLGVVQPTKEEEIEFISE